MSTRSVVLSGAAAGIIAITLIAFGILAGIPTLLRTTTSTPGTSVGVQGTLSVLLTDPPNVPAGVTKVYITYANLAVHVSESSDSSGWWQIKSTGTIELMGTVNVAQTLSSVKLTSGDYNAIRFNITSALVTYNAKNYTAFVPSGELKVPIIGGVEVSASKPSATILDISPTVINIGSASSPEFIIRPVAKAFPVPSSEVSEQTQHEGFRASLEGKAWWKDLQQKFTANLQVTSATLTGTSLSATVKDTSQKSDDLLIVVVSPLATTLGGGRDHMPSAFFDSSIFVIQKNGTLVPLLKYIQSDPSLRSDGHQLVEKLFAQIGYSLTAGTSHTFTYSGQISLGFIPSKTPLNIVAGQQYLITVLGVEALASTVVVAS